ncbi:MAG: hypothetical protein IH958_04905 [Chloroflexi bacterium]|nr:hypothetical protein [Chloroflexota bacterium]
MLLQWFPQLSWLFSRFESVTRHARVWILLALVLSLLATACANGEERGPATSDPLSGILYVRTSGYLIRFDLAKRTAEPRELEIRQFLLPETAVVAGNHLVLASVSRSEDDEWIVTLHVLDGATGREQNRIVLDPLRDVPPVPNVDDPDRFDFANSLRIWYVPQTHKLLVGIAISQTETTSFRLDIIDSEDLVRRRSIELGDTQKRGGDIHVAMDMAGNVAVLLTSSPHSRLLVSSPDLSSFEAVEAVDKAISDCVVSDAASTYRSEALYFFCLSPIPDTVQFQASILVVENTKGVRLYRLPERFSNLQGGTADAGDRIFIGNSLTATVLALDLATGEIVAQRQFELASTSSWRERLKRFIFGQPAFARLVVFKPIVISPDGKRIFLTDGHSALWCIRPSDLSLVGQVELEESIQVLGMTADGTHLVAAGGLRIEIVNGAQCRLEDTLPYSPREGPEQILVP